MVADRDKLVAVGEWFIGSRQNGFILLEYFAINNN